LSNADLYNPTQFTVFSGNKIIYRWSDFEGQAGAVSDIHFADFHLNYEAHPKFALISGGDIKLTGGQVASGDLYSPGVITLDRVPVNGYLHYGQEVKNINDSSPIRGKKPWIQNNTSQDARLVKARLLKIMDFFNYASQYFKDLAQQRVRPSDGILSISSQSRINSPVTVTEEDFRKTSVIRIDGSSLQLVVINILGGIGEFFGKDVQLSGGITPNNILFNFSQTHTLKVGRSGSQEFGIPGTILAPHAQVEFTDGRISGALLVGDLCGDGQVNGYLFNWSNFKDLVQNPPQEPPCNCSKWDS